jgi:hypothetical protein
MFTNKIWITNGIKKIKNPTQIPGVGTIYQGEIDEYVDFKRQIENCKKIKELLEPEGIVMTEIYSAKRGNKTVFVVLFNNPNFMWQKYAGNAQCSDQNYVYYKEYKINTTIFVDLNHDEVSELLNGINPQIFVQRRINKQYQ